LKPIGEPSPTPDDGVRNSQVAETINGKLLQRLHKLTPTQFEKLIAEAMTRHGFEDVMVTRRSYDGGIDGICRTRLVGLSIAFQAKRYGADANVGASAVRELRGVVVGKHAAGVFVTTSAFTPGAREAAEEPGVNITLIDGEAFVQQLLRLHIGIKDVVTQAEIDEEFFGSLGQAG
jgi:restriction system protein